MEDAAPGLEGENELHEAMAESEGQVSAAMQDAPGVQDSEGDAADHAEVIKIESDQSEEEESNICPGTAMTFSTSYGGTPCRPSVGNGTWSVPLRAAPANHVDLDSDIDVAARPAPAELLPSETDPETASPWPCLLRGGL